MTYTEGEELISKNQHLMGFPLIDREGKKSEYSNINLMLIASSETLHDIFDNWFINGKNNKIAVDNLSKSVVFFDVFVCNYTDKGLMAYSSLEIQLNRMNQDRGYLNT